PFTVRSPGQRRVANSSPYRSLRARFGHVTVPPSRRHYPLRTRRWLSVLGLLLSLSLVAAACGGDDDDTETNTDDTTDTGDSTDTEGASGDLSGELVGAGASSQEAAMGGWVAGYADVQPG